MSSFKMKKGKLFVYVELNDKINTFFFVINVCLFKKLHNLNCP